MTARNRLDSQAQAWWVQTLYTTHQSTFQQWVLGSNEEKNHFSQFTVLKTHTHFGSFPLPPCLPVSHFLSDGCSYSAWRINLHLGMCRRPSSVEAKATMSPKSQDISTQPLPPSPASPYFFTLFCPHLHLTLVVPVHAGLHTLTHKCTPWHTSATLSTRACSQHLLSCWPSTGVPLLCHLHTTGSLPDLTIQLGRSSESRRPVTEMFLPGRRETKT